jgi:N-acetylmuramoyl-L-alanine amidase
MLTLPVRFIVGCLVWGICVQLACGVTANAEGANTVTTTNTENYSLLTTTVAPNTVWDITADGLKLQPQRFLTLSSSPRFLVKPLPKSSQLVVEFPNAALKDGLTPKQLAATINQNGVQAIRISSHKGSLMSSVSVVIAYSPTVPVATLIPSKNNSTQEILIPFPIAAGRNTSHQNVGTLEGTTVVPYKFVNTPIANVPNTEPSVTPTTIVPEAPITNKTVLKGLEVEDEFLLLKPSDGSGMLKVKSQFYLEKPNRFVVDLEPAQLSADLFTGEATASLKAPTSGVTQWNGWTVRLSQNTPSIVRLVIETEGSKNFKLLEGSPQAPVAFRNALVVQPTGGKRSIKEITNQSVSSANGNLTNVYFSPPTSNGSVKMRLEASVPMNYKVAVESNQRLVLSLPNIAPPDATGVQQFDVKSFPYLKALSHVAARKGSAIVIEFTQEVKDLRYLPFTAQRALELSFAVPTVPQTIPASSVRNPKGRIVVDAGHGGKDQGTSRAGVLEKDLNLACAGYLVEALKRRGLEVYTTRRSDVFLELREISAIANRYEPDLFVSIHHNSSTDANIAGLETYYYHAPSVPLANAVHAALVNALPVKDRGVRKAQFYVINHTTAPAILVELGYVSNSAERQELNTIQRQKKAAEAIADGVVQYLRQQRR